DYTEVGAAFEEVRREAVPQGVTAHVLFDARGLGDVLDDPLDGAGREVTVGVRAGKQPGGGGIRVAVEADGLNGSAGQEGVAILAALPAPDADEPALDVEVGHAEAHDLPRAQAGGVEEHEEGAVLGISGAGEDARDLVRAQDGR